jgi:hypothetical protein
MALKVETSCGHEYKRPLLEEQVVSDKVLCADEEKNLLDTAGVGGFEFTGEH